MYYGTIVQYNNTEISWMVEFDDGELDGYDYTTVPVAKQLFKDNSNNDESRVKESHTIIEY